MPIRPGPLIIPAAVMKRLPMYHRFLNNLMGDGVEKISSKQLSKMMGITSSQLRQDLSCFGEFGQQGYGYRISELYSAFCEILGIEKKYAAVLVGAGNLGKAIINYSGFRKRGLNLEAAFDISPAAIGHNIYGLKIRDIKDLPAYLEQNQIEIGVIATPADAAQEVALILVKGGVRGIWNFAPCCLKDTKKVIVQDTHLADGLLSLFFKMKHNC